MEKEKEVKKVKIKRTIFYMIAFFIICPTAYSGSKETARKLGKYLYKSVVLNYMCKDYIGPEYYEISRIKAIIIYSKITGNKEEAVLQISKIEEKLKTGNLNKSLKINFDKRGLSNKERKSICLEMISKNNKIINSLVEKLKNRKKIKKPARNFKERI